MRLLRRFALFWYDFIVGDAWEVAGGIAVTLAVIAFATRRWGGAAGFGFVLLAAVLLLTAISLDRTTRSTRRER